MNEWISPKISRANSGIFASKLHTDIPGGPSGVWNPLWHPLSGVEKLPYLFLALPLLSWLRTFLPAENTGLDMADERMNNVVNSAMRAAIAEWGKSDVKKLGFTTTRLYYPARPGGFSANGYPAMATKKGQRKRKKNKDGPPPRQIEPRAIPLGQIGKKEKGWE